MTAFEERGYFWWSDEEIPHGQLTPSAKVAGVLRIAEDGRITLELDGLLSSKTHPIRRILDQRNEDIEGKTIFGMLKSRNEFAIIQNVLRNGIRIGQGISFEGYIASICLIRKNLTNDNNNNLLFKTIIWNLNGFEEWVQMDAIKLQSENGSVIFEYKKN